MLNDATAAILALPPSSAPPSPAAGGSASALQIQSDALCTQGYVDCLDGYLRTDASISCTLRRLF